MVQFVHLVLLVITVSTASWVPKGMSLNVLVGSDQGNMAVQARQYLNVSTGFYLVLQPDCNLILYNRSQPVMSTNTSCGMAFGNTTLTNVNVSLQTSASPLDTKPELDLLITQWYSDFSASTISQWSYHWNAGTPSPLYPYMILRDNGSCDFYDFNGSHLNGSGYNGNPGFLNPYWGPVGPIAPSPAPASRNASDLSTVPNIAYPFPPELAWKPPTSLDGFPYMPAGYFLSQGSQLQTVDRKFTLMFKFDCNLQSRETSKNGSEIVLWQSETSDNSPKILDCELMLQKDGRLVIRNNASGVVYWNVSNATGPVSVSWVLRLSSNDRGLSISDIENSTNVLWRNFDPNPINPTDQTVETNQVIRTTTWIVVWVTVGVFVIPLAGLALFYLYTRTNILDPAEKAFRRRLEENGGKPQTWFSDAKIKQATNNFGNRIGSGGFGDVFYGKLPDGQEIAAKVLSAESHQSKREFYNEGECCGESSELEAENKYRPSSCRRYFTQRVTCVGSMFSGWDLSICMTSAPPSIIHRDVKSTNILLTDKLVAKVADFGLSKLRSRDQEGATHVTTIVKGTPGYLDPEYHETGMLTDKSDVYAFGIVLMEILTGQHQMYIAHRVAEAWRLERLDDLRDPNLAGEYERDEFVSLVELSLWCVRRSSGERPFMRQVVQRLREMGLTPLEPLQPEVILGDDGQQVMALDIEFENSEDSIARDTVPLSGSFSSDRSSEIWRSGMQFPKSGRS